MWNLLLSDCIDHLKKLNSLQITYTSLHIPFLSDDFAQPTPPPSKKAKKDSASKSRKESKSKSVAVTSMTKAEARPPPKPRYPALV